MKYKDLTDEIIEEAATIYRDRSLSWDTRIRMCGDLFGGKSERRTRSWLSELGISTDKEIRSPQYEEAKKRKANQKVRRFLITWGQSETSPHDQFMNNLEVYAKFLEADIHVIAGRYKNPTSLTSSRKVRDSETWHSRLVPYLDAARHDLHEHLAVISDVKIQPTAINPMSGLQSISGPKSCVIGSPRVHMESVSVLENQPHKVMMTTGACTHPNYTDTKAGKKGVFHHTIGFVVVEIEDKHTVHMRQVTADEKGNFMDLWHSVENGDILPTGAEALVMGDIHYGNHDQKVLDITREDMIPWLNPKHVILHDLFDGYSINHHHDNDPFMQYAKEYHNTNELASEIDQMIEFLTTIDAKKVVVVRSNHDDFIDRWLKNTDWRKQTTAKNNELYMEFSRILMEQYKKDPENVKGVLPELITSRLPYKKYNTLGKNDSYTVKGWELGHHGDIGTNGSRGGLNQFRNLNSKVVVAHYHSPERKDGALSVGTSTKLRMGYNLGPSRWMHGHVIIHPNGKAQHLLINTNDKGAPSYTTVGKTVFNILTYADRGDSPDTE